VALVALDNLFPPGDDRPHAQVLADYGDTYLANFSAPADPADPADAPDDIPEVKPRVAMVASTLPLSTRSASARS